MVAVQTGYGEYIVTRKEILEGGANRTVLHDLGANEYQLVYLTGLEPNSPYRIVHNMRELNAHSPVDSPQETQLKGAVNSAVADRYTQTRFDCRRVATQGPGAFELIFIPRTLYELFYLNELMRQELHVANYVNWTTTPMDQYDRAHVHPDVNRDAENIRLSRQVNNLILAEVRAQFLPTRVVMGQAIPVRPTLDLPLTAAQLKQLLEAQLAKYVALVNDATARQSGYPFMLPSGARSGQDEMLGTRLRTLGTLQAEAQTLCEAIRAVHEVEILHGDRQLLYRGTQHPTDSLAAVNGSNGFPISYNSGLFGTLVYDRSMVTSTPSFMLAPPTDNGNYKEGYCLAIPYGDMISRKFPFHVPFGNTLKQLHGTDQPTHAWSKTHRGYYPAQLGVQGATDLPVTSHLRYMEYHAAGLPAVAAEFARYQRPYLPAILRDGYGYKHVFYSRHY